MACEKLYNANASNMADSHFVPDLLFSMQFRWSYLRWFSQEKFVIPGFSACRETPKLNTFIYQRNIVAKVATKLEFLVAKLKVVLALATVSVAISSPD